MVKEDGKVELLNSLINGFERDNLKDINNAVFLGQKILGTNFGFDFRDSSIHGVVSYELNVIAGLNNIKSNGNGKAYGLGKKLSQYRSEELAQAAKFLFSGDAQIYPYDISKAKKLSEEILSLKP
jgi:hypothetical protein